MKAEINKTEINKIFEINLQKIANDFMKNAKKIFPTFPFCPVCKQEFEISAMIHFGIIKIKCDHKQCLTKT